MIDAELPRKALLRPDEAAAALRVSRRTVYRLIADGFLHAVRVGTQLRITREALLDYLDPSRQP